MKSILRTFTLAASLKDIVQWCQRIGEELIGDDPMLRLRLVFTLAQTVGAIGVVGFLFGLFGGLFKLLCWMSGDASHPELKVGEMLDKSFWRILIGYGAAVVIHAVAMLHEKKTPPNKTP